MRFHRAYDYACERPGQQDKSPRCHALHPVLLIGIYVPGQHENGNDSASKRSLEECGFRCVGNGYHQRCHCGGEFY